MWVWVPVVAKMLGTALKWVVANRETAAAIVAKAVESMARYMADRTKAAENPASWVKFVDKTLEGHGTLLVDVTKQVAAIQEGLERTASQLDTAAKQLTDAIGGQAKEIDQRLAAADRKARLATYSAWVSVGIAVVALMVAIVK